MPESAHPTVYQRIRQWLDDQQIDYRHIQHPPTRTSEESARARGESTRIGGKSLVMKAGADRFVIVVISAARKLRSSALRKALGEDRMRFATPDELDQLTGGLVPGSVPPFGHPIIPLPLYVDQSVLANDRIAFNAGSLTDSIIMSTADYQRIITLESILEITRSAD